MRWHWPERAALAAMNFDFEQRKLSGIGIVAAALGAFALSAAGYDYLETAREAERWGIKASEVKRLSQRKAVVITADAQRDPTALRNEIRLANAVLHQIALPWDELFIQLEKARDKSVGLLAIEPDLQNRTVRIRGEARNLRGLVDYARRLEATEVLHKVYIANHEVKREDPQRPVGFSLVASWR